jgi:phosphoglycerate dehydrogenase-like enzyme
VLEEEPKSKNNPLLGQDRLVLIPPVAGLMDGAQGKTSVLVAEEVIKVLRCEPSLCGVGSWRRIGGVA